MKSLRPNAATNSGAANPGTDSRVLSPGVSVALGALTLTIGERVLRIAALSWSGAAIVVGTVLWAWHRHRRSAGEARGIARLEALGVSGVLAAVGLYGLGTGPGLDLLHVPVGHAFERALDFAWPSLALCAACFTAGVEVVARGLKPVLDQLGSAARGHVRDAGLGALTVAFAVITVAAINVAANAREVRIDLSYFGVTEASETTQRMVRGLGEPVRAIALFPEGHDVWVRMRPFFEGLGEQSELFSHQRVDHALVPRLADVHRINGNGYVALIRGEADDEQAEIIEVGLDLAAARSALRTLDGRFQEAFSRLTQPRREIHFTVGHRERGLGGDETPAERLGEFVLQMRRFNFVPRELGVSQGLATRVPESAALVAVVGPREPLAPEESAAILEHARTGGRVLALTDHDGGGALDELLEGLGVTMLPGELRATESFVPRTRTNADRRRIYTTRFSQHPIVRTARARRTGHAVVLDGAAALAATEPAPTGSRVVFPLRSEDDTWRDIDGDDAQSEGEPAAPEPIIAAITLSGGGRVVVIGDSSFLGDDLFTYRGTRAVAGDALQWLLGDLREAQPPVVGVTTTDEDSLVEHKHAEDALFFYATSFGVPVPLLFAGLMLARQRRRRRESDDEPASDSGSAETERPVSSEEE